MKTCCCTGHRPQNLPWGDRNEGKACDNYLKELNCTIVELANSGCTHFISGMALGVDVDFAEIVLCIRDEKEFVITLECAMPCKNQTLKWKTEQIKRYETILARADIVTLLICTRKHVC